MNKLLNTVQFILQGRIYPTIYTSRLSFLPGDLNVLPGRSRVTLRSEHAANENPRQSALRDWKLEGHSRSVLDSFNTGSSCIGYMLGGLESTVLEAESM